MQLLLVVSFTLSIVSATMNGTPFSTYRIMIISYVAVGFHAFSFLVAYLFPSYVAMRKTNIAFSIACVLISVVVAFSLQVAGSVYMASQNNSYNGYSPLNANFAFSLASAIVDFINFSVFFLLFYGLAAEREPEVDASSEDSDRPKRRYDFLPLLICA